MRISKPDERKIMAQSKQKGLGELTDKQLMAEWTKLGKQVEKDKEKLREFSHEHQRRERLRQLNLTPGDLELLQGVEPEQIESEEKVNG